MTVALEQRVLILAPVGRDAPLIQQVLQGEDVPCVICPTLLHLAAEMSQGAGAVIVAEEALGDPADTLGPMLSRQPPWSDLPVMVLTRVGASSFTAEQAVANLGNVTLLERPVRVTALTSAVRTALRARARQYLTRTHLAERDRADQRKDEFLATLAHELRNPLAPIRTSLDLLQLAPKVGVLPEIVATMDRQVTHMMRLVDDLLDVSRVTRGKIQLKREPLALRTIMDAAVEIARPALVAAGHQLSVSYPARHAAVEGDAVRLTQVFANLLNNAVKYTDAGGKIQFRAKAGAQWVQVDVCDNGIGIASATLPKLFEMFFQVAEGTRLHTGLGIGLTLVRTLVEMHGGSVTAHSLGLGKGSRFSVRLPAGKAAIAPAPEPEPLEPPVHVRHLRVMVVDDNRDAADSLAMLLCTLGAEVHVAHDGPGALAALEWFHPEAIFLDIGMPGMDGYELAGRVRQREEEHHPLLVALTGWGQERDRVRVRAAGFAHHLVKPADAGKLRAVLASVPVAPAGDLRAAS